MVWHWSLWHHGLWSLYGFIYLAAQPSALEIELQTPTCCKVSELLCLCVAGGNTETHFSCCCCFVRAPLSSSAPLSVTVLIFMHPLNLFDTSHCSSLLSPSFELNLPPLALNKLKREGKICTRKTLNILDWFYMRGGEVKEKIIHHPHMQKETGLVLERFNCTVFTFSEWFLWVFRGLSPQR